MNQCPICKIPWKTNEFGWQYLGNWVKIHKTKKKKCPVCARDEQFQKYIEKRDKK